MRKLLILLMALTMLLTLSACVSKTDSADNITTLLKKQFPADWADRYILNETEDTSIDVFCKSAYDNSDNNGWLFQIIYGDDSPDDLPVMIELGTYEGKVVFATYPSDVYEFEDDTVAEDYRDMASDVEDILHQLLHALGGEHDHGHAHDEHESSDKISTGTYVIPESIGIDHTYVGVFHLDTTLWSEESKNELLDEHNQTGFISIAPDGTAYLRCGNVLTEGSVLIYSEPDHIPDNIFLYQFTFDGNNYNASMYQSVFTIDDMPEFTDINDMQSTTWTFIHESDDWWTENTLA